MRLSGVGMSPSVKTFICWQLRRWVSREGYKGTLGARRTGDDGGLPAGPGSAWELPGWGGGVHDSPCSQLFCSASKENDSPPPPLPAPRAME